MKTTTPVADACRKWFEQASLEEKQRLADQANALAKVLQKHPVGG